MRIASLALMYVSAVTALAAQTGQKPPEGHIALMKETASTLQTLRQSLEANDFQTVATAADAMKTLFALSEGFWMARESESGVNLARSARMAADNLETAAGAGRETDVAAAMKMLTGTCASCHSAHRGTLPDGTYEIR